jgi:hypothetical protein
MVRSTNYKAAHYAVSYKRYLTSLLWRTEDKAPDLTMEDVNNLFPDRRYRAHPETMMNEHGAVVE